MTWIDAHCHPQLYNLAEARVLLNTWKNHTLLTCATNLTDLHQLKFLQTEFPQISICAGWHPWKIPSTSDKQMLQRTCNRLAEIISELDTPIGEVGLDFHPRWKESIDQQMWVFQFFLDLAHQLKRPLILHCVRAHHEILRRLKKYPSLRIYLHDFFGNPQIVEQYQKYDVFFGYAVQRAIVRYQQLIDVIPTERILLESDGLLHLNTFQRYCAHDSLQSILAMQPQTFSRFCQ